MSKRVDLSVKKPEGKVKGPVTSSSKTDLSQSMEINSPVQQVLHLQRTIGNQAVTRLIQSGVLQAKLNIGQPGDIYEQEADRVAEQVMRMSEEPLVNSHWSLARKEEGLVQARGDCGQSSDISSCVESHINALKGSGRPLSPATRDYFEPRFGSDFSQVRVHTGSDAAAIAKEINARAFTTGRDVFFGAGQYSPTTSGGKRLIAHELTHVVQQKGGIGQNSRITTDNEPGIDALKRSGGQRPISREVVHVLQQVNSDEYFQRFASCGSSEACPGREGGEVGRSRRDPMFVGSVSGPHSGLLVANFAIGSAALKSDLHSNPAWANFWGQMVTNTNIEWDILGFTDCQGSEGTNLLLRWQRAIAVNNALPRQARSQVIRFAAAPMNECIASNTSEQGRMYNRSAFIRMRRTSYDFEEGSRITANPFAACYDGTRVYVRKNGRSHSCPALTGNVGAPTPNGIYLIRRQGEAQRTRWYRDRSRWYLLEPQFTTTRSRMHLHSGSFSAGCITVTDSSCFNQLAAILNGPGTVSGPGYDGYPPGNTAGVSNPRRTVTGVGWLKVDRTAGACAFMNR